MKNYADSSKYLKHLLNKQSNIYSNNKLITLIVKMARTLTNTPLIMLFFKTCTFIKIFEFNISPEGNILYIAPEYRVNTAAFVSSKPFTFCGSFKASSLHGESFFTFYGED